MADGNDGTGGTGVVNDCVEEPFVSSPRPPGHDFFEIFRVALQELRSRNSSAGLLEHPRRQVDAGDTAVLSDERREHPGGNARAASYIDDVHVRSNPGLPGQLRAEKCEEAGRPLELVVCLGRGVEVGPDGLLEGFFSGSVHASTMLSE